MSGFELGKRLHAERPDLPVLYMSGHVDLSDHGGAQGGRPEPTRPLARDELIAKPFSPDELIERVQQAIVRSASAVRRP
jgi:CheY-like chemotaxis protein